MKMFLQKKLNHGKAMQIVCMVIRTENYLSMLNDYYKYAAAIKAKREPFLSEPLIMVLLLSPNNKMIDWLTKQISKYELVHNKKEVKKSKEEHNLAREKTNDYIRKNGGRIHYFDDD
jgi:hypothetical protein